MNIVVPLLLLLAASPVAIPEAPGPDGLIIERQSFVLDPRTALGAVLLGESTEVAGGARVWKPAYRCLDALEISRITYWGDGPKVKGFLLVPKEGGRHPSVIWVRGGAREFGALDDAAVVRSLARLASRGYVVAASQFRGVAGGEGRDEYGGADHGWTEHGPEARAMVDAWLDRFVRDGEPPPDVVPRD